MSQLLEKVIDQTSFLLDKQKESLRDCTAILKDLLNAIENKLNKTTNPEERETLEKVFDAVSGQAQKMADYIQDDVDFLTEQLNAFTEVKNINDPAKIKEVLDMMLGEDTELDDTATFKKNILDEAVLSKQNLLTVVQDLKEAISEGNAEEVDLFLQTLLDDEDNDDMDEDFDDEDDDACCDDDEEGCCNDEQLAPCVCGKGKNGKCTCPSKKATTESSCGGCTGCAGGGCGSGCGSSEEFDLFALLNEDDEETKKKLRSSDKKTGCC